MTEAVRATEDAGILTLTLARPEKKNALTNAMYDSLTAALTRAGAEPAIRVVVLAGDGDMFTAGNDIGEFAAVAAGTEPATGLAAWRFILALARFDKPLVAAVEGDAAGIGTTMLLHCDVVFVAETARLTTPFVDLALVPEAASSWLLPARIGHARAYAMFALGEAIGGHDAARLGIATAALPAAGVRACAMEAARLLSRKPAGALRATKRLMRDAAAIEAVMAREAEVFRAQLQTPEAADAFRAFAERHKPGAARR